MNMEGVEGFYPMLGADHRTRLEALFDGRGVDDLHIESHLRRPETPSHARWRTMELKPEDRIDLEDARRDMLYRPEDGEYAVQLRKAEAGAGAHRAEDDGSGKSTNRRAKPEGRKSLDERVEDVFGLDPDIERPKGLLPMPGKIDENGKGLDNVDWSSWTAPEWVHESARAVALPKHVLDGGDWSSEDATKAAMTMAAGGAAASTPSDALRSGVTRLRGTPKFMRKIDLEEQGKAAARKVMNSKSSVPQAMFREDVGEITFDYGVAKEGFEHIRKGRMEKDGMTEQEATKFVTERIPEVLAHGEASRIYGPENGRRIDIVHQGRKVILSLRRHDNQETWVLTGYEEW